MNVSHARKEHNHLFTHNHKQHVCMVKKLFDLSLLLEICLAHPSPVIHFIVSTPSTPRFPSCPPSLKLITWRKAGQEAADQPEVLCGAALLVAADTGAALCSSSRRIQEREGDRSIQLRFAPFSL